MKIWKTTILAVAALALGLILGGSGGEEPYGGSIGSAFHDETELNFGEVISSVLRWGEEPKKEKYYEGARVIDLPDMAEGNAGVEEAIERRRSARDFSGGSLSLSQLSRLLHSSSGITGKSGKDSGFRAAPSAGALYPIETYVVSFDVEGMDPGIYHYIPSRHHLELVREGNFHNDFISAALYQDMAGRCDLLYVLTSVFRRVTWKYGDRGYRYAYIEAGAISENIYLQATSLGLVSVLIGAFFDDKVSELIGIDGRKEAPILLHAVGT
jgi:SagB-type dehydrogenase family enzyme